MRLTSGGGSSGGGSAALARMKSGSGNGVRLSAKPQPDSVTAVPAMVMMKEIACRRIARSYPIGRVSRLKIACGALNHVRDSVAVRNRDTGDGFEMLQRLAMIAGVV